MSAWQVERDRFGLLFSGKVLAVGEYIEVVPCDDAAVERAAQHLYELDDERARVDGVEWANEPDGYKMLWRDKARAVFAAAGEIR